MAATWVTFRADDSNRVLPPERRYVLVMLALEDRRQAVAVGYLRYAAGDLTCPFFVVPGIGGEVTHWSDCLGDGFDFPGGGRAGQHGRRYRVRLPVTRGAVPALKP